MKQEEAQLKLKKYHLRLFGMYYYRSFLVRSFSGRKAV